jgi:hypothetical protein
MGCWSSAGAVIDLVRGRAAVGSMSGLRERKSVQESSHDPFQRAGKREMIATPLLYTIKSLFISILQHIANIVH